MEVTRDAICLEGEYARALAITCFPREVSPGWLAPLLLHDDIADIQPDAKFDAPLRWNRDVALGHLALDVDGAAYCVDDAGELNEKAVAGRLDDAPAMLRDFWVEDGAAMALQIGESAFLVNAHQP